MFVHGSAQNAYYIHDAVKRVLGCGDGGVHALQDVTGGGFGGKEEYPSILGCQVAVAAHKCGKPVRCVLDRREDMQCTSKRHPSVCCYRAAVKDGRVTAMDIDVKFNAGAYSTLSAVVWVFLIDRPLLRPFFAKLLGESGLLLGETRREGVESGRLGEF